MEPFRVLTGLVAPLDRANVDTDAIIPKQFLKSIARSGFGPNLFDAWRYLDRGEPGTNAGKRAQNPDFVLNQPRYRGAQILLTRRNFGCGSSREHAAWALQEFGFQAIVAESFGDIFRTNCSKNGLLTIALPAADVRELLDAAPAPATVDLEAQAVTLPSGRAVSFDVDPNVRERLLNGWDDIALTERRAAEIDRYEAERERTGPDVLAL
jgi:3-isopropylmalate/(R)-2-methylmalate dehydratase small subunit